MEGTSNIWLAEKFTCIIASHISSITRLQWLEECIQNCQQFFNKVILSVSYEENMCKYITSLSGTLSHKTGVTVVIHNQRKLQFEHIKSVASLVKTKNVIFMDDDDLFLPSVINIVAILFKRYKQHAGVQIKYDELDDNGNSLVDVDFSGTFCTTEFLLAWLKNNPDEIHIYDADCTFVTDLSAEGRGVPNNYTDFGIDEDIIPYVSRRTHNLERDWGK